MSWSFSGLTNAVVSAVIAPTTSDGDSSIEEVDEQIATEGEDVSAAIMNFGAAGFGSVLRGATSLAKQMPGALQATLESLDNVTGGGAGQSPSQSPSSSTEGWSNDDGIDDLVESDVKGVDIGVSSGSNDSAVRNIDLSVQSVSALEAEANRLQRENQQLLAGLRQSKRTVLEEKSRADAFKAHAADLETRLIAESEKEAKQIDEITTRLHESESRLTREVEEREKDDEEWQKRIKVMQQDFRTREGSREDRLSELTDRVSYLERELSQERERRETAEARVAGLQVALGEERDKASDAKVREDRARAEVNAISREGFVDSSE
jgi:DNA repair exonuclease SbcCD ATPase subunit